MRGKKSPGNKVTWLFPRKKSQPEEKSRGIKSLRKKVTWKKAQGQIVSTPLLQCLLCKTYYKDSPNQIFTFSA